jgi:hypothetical protein
MSVVAAALAHDSRVREALAAAAAAELARSSSTTKGDSMFVFDPVTSALNRVRPAALQVVGALVAWRAVHERIRVAEAARAWAAAGGAAGWSGLDAAFALDSVVEREKREADAALAAGTRGARGSGSGSSSSSVAAPARPPRPFFFSGENLLLRLALSLDVAAGFPALRAFYGDGFSFARNPFLVPVLIPKVVQAPTAGSGSSGGGGGAGHAGEDTSPPPLPPPLDALEAPPPIPAAADDAAASDPRAAEAARAEKAVRERRDALLAAAAEELRRADVASWLPGARMDAELLVSVREAQAVIDAERA